MAHHILNFSPFHSSTRLLFSTSPIVLISAFLCYVSLCAFPLYTLSFCYSSSNCPSPFFTSPFSFFLSFLPSFLPAAFSLLPHLLPISPLFLTRFLVAGLGLQLLHSTCCGMSEKKLLLKEKDHRESCGLFEVEENRGEETGRKWNSNAGHVEEEPKREKIAETRR